MFGCATALDLINLIDDCHFSRSVNQYTMFRSLAAMAWSDFPGTIWRQWWPSFAVTQFWPSKLDTELNLAHVSISATKQSKACECEISDVVAPHVQYSRSRGHDRAAKSDNIWNYLNCYQRWPSPYVTAWAASIQRSDINTRSKAFAVSSLDHRSSNSTQRPADLIEPLTFRSKWGMRGYWCQNGDRLSDLVLVFVVRCDNRNFSNIVCFIHAIVCFSDKYRLKWI